MSPLQSLASGLRALPAPGAQAFSSTQAAWRFLANERVDLPTLAAPLLEASGAAAATCCERVALVVHDWSVLNYSTHARKAKRVQVARRGQEGYELATALLISDRDGAPLGPLCQELRAADGWHSSRQAAVCPRAAWRLDALAAPLEFIAGLPLGRPVVHLIDREADSVAHYRAWAEAGHRFVVRADDRRVQVPGAPQEESLSQLVARLIEAGALREVGSVRHRGQTCVRQVAECRVILTRPAHPERRQKDGSIRRERRAGAPLELRLVVGRLWEPTRGQPAGEWWLLTNVEAAQADAATLVNWSAWRWQIESFFKLLKGSGHHLEEWGQREPKALAKRLLIASLACVLVWQLARDQSPPAQAAARLLVRLSGRQTKRAKPITEPALLAGLWSLLGVLNVLEDHSIEELRATADFILGKLV